MSTDFFEQRIFGHLEFGLDLDQLLGHRGIGEILLGQLAQVRVHSFMNFDQSSSAAAMPFSNSFPPW